MLSRSARSAWIEIDGIQVTSDRAKKKNIKQLNISAANKIRALKFYTYDLIDGETDKIGIMHDEAPKEIASDANGKRTIDLYAYVSLLAKAFQELTLEVDDIKKRMER